MAITFKDYIYNCYSAREGAYESFRRWGWDSLEMSISNPFARFMRVPLIEDVIEVPCIYKYPVMEALLENKRTPNKIKKEIYIPMMCLDNDTVVSRSSNPVLKKFFHDTRGETNLVRKTGGNTVYLGGQGLIMYEDFRPLMMLSLLLKKENNLYAPIQQILRINPIVYNEEDILAKNIRTKFIQGILNMKLSNDDLSNLWYSSRRSRMLNPYNMLTTGVLNYSFKIIIEDFSQFFVTPNAPDATFDSAQLNKMLLEDSDFINSL